MKNLIESCLDDRDAKKRMDRIFVLARTCYLFGELKSRINIDKCLVHDMLELTKTEAKDFIDEYGDSYIVKASTEEAREEQVFNLIYAIMTKFELILHKKYILKDILCNI